MGIKGEKQIDLLNGEDINAFVKSNINKYSEVECLAGRIVREVAAMDLDDSVEAINRVRAALHEVSPFKSEPVDFVRWIKNTNVVSNDYNPNKVAPAEMKLLELSIVNDGYTQPIVGWSSSEKGMCEVIDGFHRNRVGKESRAVQDRVKGYLPVVDIRTEQSGKSDRMASTIRHNRARGKHQVDAMCEIVIELKNRNWRNARIAKELGMDEEEVLRLCQISGLESLFSDNDFSKAWVAEDSNEFEALTDKVDSETVMSFRTANTGDEDRIFHTYDKWECHEAGFYASNFQGKTADQCKEAYRDFLSNSNKFAATLKKVTSEWVNSCEHYLTNIAMNRIAWLGQASMCYATGIPSKYCSGFSLLTGEQKEEANMVALEALNEWLIERDREAVSMDVALSSGRQAEIY